jgi:hypothetical protein
LSSPEPGLSTFSLPGRPLAALVGPDQLFVLDGGGACAVVRFDGSVLGLPAIGPWAAAALTPWGELAVALYDRMLAILRGDGWEYVPLPAAPLALAGARGALLVGAADGVIRAVTAAGAPDIVTDLDAPVVDLVGLAAGFAALDATGAAWFVATGTAKPVRVPVEERVTGLFGGAERLGCRARERLALFEVPGLLRLGEVELEAEIAQVGGGVVLTDAGNLHLLGPSLENLGAVRIPNESGRLRGLSSLGSLVWSEGGALFRVEGGRVRQVGERVVLVGEGSRTAVIGELDGGYVVRWDAAPSP